MSEQVLIGDGRVVLPRALCDRYLASAPAAVLLARDGQVFLVPLGGPGAGGMLLKQRNAQGDRVLVADEFLAERGLGRFSAECVFVVRWQAEAGALLVEGLR